jgi:alkylation response protein AidB-like acyl-CoA dehydrogenase
MLRSRPSSGARQRHQAQRSPPGRGPSNGGTVLTTTATGAQLTVGELGRRARHLLPEIAAGAADRERRRLLPYEQVRRIADAGLLTFRVPGAYGGPGASVSQTFGFIVDLAAADANVAQSVRSAFLFVESLVASDSEERERWFPRVLAGDVFANAGWERGGRNGEIRARITRDGDNFLASGTKSYSTGALFADWVSTAALDEAGTPVSFTVPRGREGLRLLDDWDGMGQRLTASGTTELDGLTVYPDEIRRRPGRGSRSPGTAVAQLYLGAVLAGIGQDALRDAVTFARNHARPIVHSKAERSVDDPYVQHAVGEISARAFAARAAVLAAAAAIDTALASPADAALLTTAAVDVAQAQFFAAEAALRCAELAFDVGGASATVREHNLDRHWRNARTVANHNPRAHKAGVVGAYHLTGAEPPTSGLF